MEYMGTKEAAEKFNVTQATVAAWCRENRIPKAEQDAPGCPWRIPATFKLEDLLPRHKHR